MKLNSIRERLCSHASRTWIVSAALLLFAGSWLSAQISGEWKNLQALQVDKAGFIKLSLPIETIDAACPGLEDLRLYDGAGREIPFRLERPIPAFPAVAAAEDFRVRLDGNATVATFASGMRQPIRRVTLETPARDFIKAATLEGSADGTKWQTLARGYPLFRRGDGASRLDIEFDAAVWPRLRITLDDRRSEPIPISGARLQAAEPETTPTEPLALSIVDRDESPGETRFSLRAAGAQAVLADIEIETPEPLFTRQVSLACRAFEENEVREQLLADGIVFRTALEGQPSVSQLGFAGGVTIPARELVLTIRNGDSPPLAVTAIRARRKPVYLTWLARQTGTFTLASGNPRCQPPRYDIAALGGAVDAELAIPASIGLLTTNPAWSSAGALPEIQEFGTAIDLEQWGFRKRLEITRSGVQQLELDPETLSRSAPQLADLRVVRDARQLPFLVERTSVIRNLEPAVERADNPERPTESRWRIRLPHPALPIFRLGCESDAPYFSREAQLWEERTDALGDIRAVRLGAAQWARTLGKERQELILESSAPETDTLLLEIENGDNPPLEFVNFRVYYRATRLIFKASAGSETYLYYGNRLASAPRYDITLVARELLASEKNRAALARAEPLRGDLREQAGSLAGRAGWIFFTALAAVVVALLVLIVRLLPKDQT